MEDSKVSSIKYYINVKVKLTINHHKIKQISIFEK